jgi:hypothetical protein
MSKKKILMVDDSATILMLCEADERNVNLGGEV